MNPELRKLERRVSELVASIDLRPTLERAAELGEVLTEAKGLIPHGQWSNWLKGLGLNDRTARRHMEVFRELPNRSALTDMTIEQFLAFMREARINDKRREREEAREVAARRLGRLPDAIRLHRADCRKFAWPTLDAICTDPPWSDMDCFRWLAGMASQKLRDGGVLLLQVGTGYLAEVMSIMTGAGLTYRWTFAVCYAEMRRAKPTAGRYLSAWNPILLFTRGGMPPGDVMGDMYTVRQARTTKTLHDWAAPAEPLAYWLGRLLPPGSLVGDPYAGSATTGVVCRQLALRWIGTEVDVGAYRVARGRLLGDC